MSSIKERSQEYKELVKNIHYIVLDVDGTLTDGGIYYDINGIELKKFYAKDGLAVKAAGRAGIECIIMTGRESWMVQKRAQETHIRHIYQNVRKKGLFLQDFMHQHEVCAGEIAFIGDDINDLPGMRECGFVACPADAGEDVLEYADYVAEKCGGHGAVREIIELIMRAQGKWEVALEMWV
jgi:3-deoxy-D-manno-octulosonate 8-phosphate phosphatase (KDO 8-P phosphatase)